MALTPPPDLISPSDYQSATEDVESGGNDLAVSPKGAVGAMQVMPATAVQPGFGVRPAANPSVAEADRVGDDYADAMLVRYGDPLIAAAAYNAGPGRVDQWLKDYGDPRKGEISADEFVGRIPYAETRNYVRKVSDDLARQSSIPAGTVIPVQGPPSDLVTPPNDLVAVPGQGPPADLVTPPNDLTSPRQEMPKLGVLPGNAFLNPEFAPEVPKGAPRPLAPGERVENPDGSWSSEITVTVTDPKLNGGKPTVIPSLWLVDGKPTRVSEDQAAAYAVESGLNFPAFANMRAADKFATEREDTWEKTAPDKAHDVPALWDPNSRGTFTQQALSEGLVPALKSIPQRFVDWYTDKFDENHIETPQGRVPVWTMAGMQALYDRSALKKQGKSFEQWQFSPEGIQAAMANPLFGFMPGEGLRRAPIPGFRPLEGEIIPPRVRPKTPQVGAPGPIVENPPQPGAPVIASAKALPAPAAEPPPAGTVVGLKFPNAPSRRARVEGYFDQGNSVRLRFDDGTARDYLTADVARDLTEPPPPSREEQAPADTGGAPVTEAESYDLMHEAESHRPPPSGPQAQQPTMGRDLILALDEADRLERDALAAGTRMTAAQRQDALLQAAHLRTIAGQKAGWIEPEAPETAEARAAQRLGPLGEASRGQPPAEPPYPGAPTAEEANLARLAPLGTSAAVRATAPEPAAAEPRIPAPAPVAAPASTVAPAPAPTPPAEAPQGPRAAPPPAKLEPVPILAAPPAEAKPVAQSEAVTSTGRAIPVEYALVDADRLVTSHTDDLRENPSYPQNLQPRDRTRGATEIQIQEMLNPNKFRPELLGPSPDAANGAPIVGPDGVVESGNARTIALRRAYDRDLPAAVAYRDYLARQGYQVEGMKAPVLVRINRANMTVPEREAFTREANKPAQLAMSATERAMSDAKALPDSALDLAQPDDLLAARNRDFVRTVLRNIASPNETGAMVGPDGALSQEGLRRVQGAVLAKAYGDPGVVQTLLESTDGNYKAIGQAMLEAAPVWAKMRAAAQEGRIPAETDITPNLVEAINIVARARNEGRNVAEYVNQRDMFSGNTLSPETESVLRWMLGGPDFTKRIGQAKVSNAARFYAQEALKTQPGPSLFGEDLRITPVELTEAARARAQAEPEAQPDLLRAAVGESQGAAGVGEGARTSREGIGESRASAGRTTASAIGAPVRVAQPEVAEEAPRLVATNKESPGLRESKAPIAVTERTAPFRPLNGAVDRLDDFAAFAKHTRTAREPMALNTAAAEYVRDRGAKTGWEFVVSYDAARNAVIDAATARRQSTVAFSQSLTDAMLSPESRLVMHHNHPAGRALSPTDIAYLARPGVQWIIAHAPDGNYSAARLTDSLRGDLLAAQDNEEAVRTLGATADKARDRADVLIRPYFTRKELTADEANAIHQEVANHILAADGLIHYIGTRAFDGPAGRVFNAALATLTEQEPDGTRRLYRPAGPVQPADGLAEILGRAGGEPAGEERIRENGNRAGEGADRATTEQTEEGEQYVIPGAERLTPEEVARHKAAEDKRIAELTMRGAKQTARPQATFAGTPLGAGKLEPLVDEEGQRRLFQDEDAFHKPFYSALERGIEAGPEKAPPQSWKGYIRNLASKGVKQDEIDWTGVNDWLDGQKGPVTKADLLQAVRENGVRLQEVMHSDTTASDFEEQWSHAADAVNAAIARRAPDAEQDRLRAIRDDLRQRQQAAQDNAGATKYRQYTLPGGENYREMLLTLPPRASAAGNAVASFAREMREKYGERWAATMPDAQKQKYDDLIRAQEAQPREAERENFRSSHWEEPNILAHIRFDDRTDADGKRDLHIAEIQSDWHQAGRRKGYQNSAREAEARLRAANDAESVARAEMEKAREAAWLKATNGRFDNIRDALGSGDRALVSRAQQIVDNDHDFKAAAARVLDLSRNTDRIRQEVKGGVPAAPFKTSWHELAAKRMLRYAAEHGYDRLSWDTGATNADRYDLSRQVERIKSTRLENGGLNLKITPRSGREIQLVVHADGTVESMHNSEFSGKPLSEVIGKDLADKIISDAQEGAKTWGVKNRTSGNWSQRFATKEEAKAYQDSLPASIKGQTDVLEMTPRFGKEYTGLDLKVGGEGMKAFYDKILPQFMNKYVKKWGAKVGETKIDAGPAVDEIYPEKEPEDYKSAHYVDITPQMRESVMQGQALFEEPDRFVNPEAANPAREANDRLDDIAEQVASEVGGLPPGTYERRLREMSLAHDANKNLHLFEPLWIFPRTVASMDTKSGKFWDAWKARHTEQQIMLHDWRNLIKPTFLKLDDAGREHVYAAEELSRLNGVVPEDDGRRLVMRNEDQPDARKSKPGQTIALTEPETKAFFERRAMFQQAWRDLIKGAARRLGWNGEPTSEAVRRAAVGANGADARHLGRIADLLNAMEEQERTGYVPFMRFGDHFIAVTPKHGVDTESLGGFPETKWFELVERPALDDLIGKALKPGETPKAVADRVAELRKRFPADQYNIATGQLSKKADILRQLDIPAVEKLLMVTENGLERDIRGDVKQGNLPHDTGARLSEVHEALFDAIRKQMYEELKAGFKRKSRDVPGWSDDWDRATGAYMHGASKNAADMIHRESIERAYDEIQNNHPHQAIKAYWRDWRRYQEDPESLLSHAGQSVSQFGAVYAMGLNPSTSAIIGLHTPMASGPALSVGVGAGAASKALGAALADMYRNARFDLRRGAHIDIASAARTPDERAFLGQLVREGLLGPRGAEDLRALDEQQSSMWGAAKSVIRRGLDVAMSNVSVVDQANRGATALAAYRLAKRTGTLDAMSRAWQGNQIFRATVQRYGLNPTTMARFLTSEAAFDWGKENAPRVGRGVGRMFMVLHGFQTRYLSGAWRLMTRMGPAGKVAALWMGAGLLAGAGVEGLPFVQDAENLIDALSKTFLHYDPMLSARIRSALAGIGFGKVGAEMIMRGPIGTMLGVDLAGRIGFGDILTRELQGTEILGTIPSILGGRILALARTGDVAQALPTGVRNPILAAEQSRRGVKSQSGRTTYVPSSKVTGGDVLKHSFGLTPLDVERAYERKGFRFRREDDRRAHIRPPSFPNPYP